MKTSNKLLMLLLVLLFSIPLVMIMGWKAAIKENRYVVKNINGTNGNAFKETGRFKAIKMNGGLQRDKPLKCDIRYGDKYGYAFKNYDPQIFEEGRSDSCTVALAGDTLVINYNIKTNEALKANNYYYGVGVEITIPETIPIVANAAMVNLDSSAARFSSLNFVLANKAELNINGNIYPRTVTKEGNQYAVIPESIFPEIVIDATTSQINLNANSSVKKLQLSLKGQSRVNFDEKSAVDTLSGSISDESVFNAPYNLVKKLKQ